MGKSIKGRKTDVNTGVSLACFSGTKAELERVSGQEERAKGEASLSSHFVPCCQPSSLG